MLQYCEDEERQVSVAEAFLSVQEFYDYSARKSTAVDVFRCVHAALVMVLM